LSAAVPLTPAAPLSNGANRLANFRIIPRIETYPKVVTLAQTVPGKLVLLALFGLCLSYYGGAWLPIAACLALITFFPTHRRFLVTFATLFLAFLVPFKASPHPLYSAMLIVLVFGFGAMLFWSAIQWPRSWYGRRPILLLLSGFFVLLIAAYHVQHGTPLYRLLWDFIYVFTTYLWFIAFALLDRKSRDCDPLSLQLGTFRPFWGSTATPFVKGSAYLRRIEARDSSQLAVIQLKGLKLLVWAILLSLLLQAFNRVVYGTLAVHTFPELLYLSADRRPLSWYHGWASLISQFLYGLLSMSILGHRIVACCRMAGFNALRNTYRPLSSRTVAEFFNRYYYYFKELLVDFFFYPTFLKYFKKKNKLRLVAAIFAAACFGNAYFHFVRDLDFVQNLGVWRALVSYQVYLFYCIVLAAAISISQIRHRQPTEGGFLRRQIWPSFLVALFYCLLDVFGATDRFYPLSEHFRFFAHLFNINF
jgi:hypothetical protein